MDIKEWTFGQLKGSSQKTVIISKKEAGNPKSLTDNKTLDGTNCDKFVACTVQCTSTSSSALYSYVPYPCITYDTPLQSIYKWN